jgi:hypothetical protein
MVQHDKEQEKEIKECHDLGPQSEKQKHDEDSG